MAKFVSPDNFMGTMRVDADSGSKPMYFPNSYHKNVLSTQSTPGFAGMDAVEAPYQVANNVVSRKSYWRDECTDREYTQVRELYLNRLSETERNNLHSNTARLLKLADDIVIEGYLVQVSRSSVSQYRKHCAHRRAFALRAQQYAIHPSYATSINDLLPDNKKANMETVKEKSKTAHMVGKSKDFQPADKGKSFMGMAY